MSNNQLALSLLINNEVRNIADIRALIVALESAGHNVDFLRSRTETLAKEWDSLNPREQGQRLRRLRESAVNLASGIDDASNSEHEFAKATEKANKQVKDLDKSTKNHSHSLTSLRTKMTTVVSAISGFVAFRKAKSYIEDVVNTGARFEQLKAQLTALTGSAENADKSLAWIKDFAKNTPSDIENVTSSFVKMKAFGLDPMDGSFQALIDQTAKLGFSQEKLDGIVLAVGQAWTKQKLQGEEALQLIERGVPVWDLLAKATGKNVVELQELSSAGKLGRQEIRLLIEEMGKSSEGAAKAQMSTWNGLVSNLKDVWLDFQNTVSESGVLDYFKGQLEQLLAKTKEMAADGSLKRFAQDISDSIIRATEAVKGFVQSLVAATPVIKATAIAFAGLKIARLASDAVSVSKSFMGQLIPALTATASSATTSTAKVGLMTSAVNALKVALNFLKSNPIVAIATTLGGALFTAINALIPKTHEWQKSVDDAFSALVDLQTKAAEGIDIQVGDLEPFNKQMDDIDRQIEELSNKDTGIFDFAKDAIPWLDSNNQQLTQLLQEKQALEAQERNLHAQIKANEQAEASRAEKAKIYAEEQKKLSEQSLELMKARKAELEKAGDTESAYYQYVTGAIHELNKTLDETSSKTREAFESVGLSLNELSTGIADAEKKIIDGVGTAIDYINQTSTSSQQAGQAIDRYLNAALAKVKSPEGMKVLLSDLKALPNQTQETKDAIEALTHNINKATPAWGELQAAITKATDTQQIVALREETKKLYEAGKLSADQYKATLADLSEQQQAANKAGIKELAESTEKRQQATQATQAQTSATEENAEATAENTAAEKENAEAKEQSRVSSQRLYDTNNLTKQQMREMTALAEDLSKAGDFRFRAGFDVDFRQQLADTAEAYRRVNAVIENLDQSIADGTVNAQNLTTVFNQATQGAHRLDSVTMERINAEIDKARAKIQALADTARDEANDLEAELKRLQGDEDYARQLEQTRKLNELEEKLARAKSRRNEEEIQQYQRAIDLQKQIFAEKEKQYEQDKKQQSERDNSSSRRSSDKSRALAGKNGGNASVIDLNQPIADAMNRLPAPQINLDSNRLAQVLIRRDREVARETEEEIIANLDKSRKGRGR